MQHPTIVPHPLVVSYSKKIRHTVPHCADTHINATLGSTPGIASGITSGSTPGSTPGSVSAGRAALGSQLAAVSGSVSGSAPGSTSGSASGSVSAGRPALGSQLAAASGSASGSTPGSTPGSTSGTPSITVERGSVRHLPYLAVYMRAADRHEVMASHGHTPHGALLNAFGRSSLVWTMLVDGKPAMMCGVAPSISLLDGTGIPWLLGTDSMELCSGFIRRHSRKFVGYMQGLYPRLENYVHAANIVSLRWLTWCGFSLDQTPQPYGEAGELFYHFWR